jgi:exoribonuclease R
MPPFKIQYDDNETWYLVDSGTLVIVPSESVLPAGFDPYSEKMFNQDIIDIGENGEVVRIASLLRNQKSISGVLVLEGNKSYGYGKTGKRMLYKCIPDDRRLPPFLVPYSLDISGFSKKFVNKYVVFKFKEWDGEKPVGELVVTIGDVNVLENFYEYQLYCKNLNASIQDFVAETKKRLTCGIESRIIADYGVEDRMAWTGIYTIDPIGSKDFDDAFGLSASAVDGCVKLSVYISNVALWMDALKLWTSFSQRISTIYLPDRKRPMLPSVLSDILCSLLENKVRFAFTMDIDVNEATGEIVGDVMFKNTSIVVERNFRYDEADLETCGVYQRALRLVRKMSPESVSDSHEFIAYIMILMNYKSAVRFAERKNGIYRSFKFKSGLEFPETLPKDVSMSLRLWHSNGSSYIKYDGEKVHHMLKFNEYVHITSPIRRLVDLLNIIQLMDNERLVAMSGDMQRFYEHWTGDESLAYINQSMRSIRKVQNDCALLAMCMTKPEVMEKIYAGFVFEAMERNDGLWLYIVYVPELKLSSKFIYYNKMDLYSEHKFKIYLFEDKDALKKKIRMEKL